MSDLRLLKRLLFKSTAFFYIIKRVINISKVFLLYSDNSEYDK